MMKIKGIVLLFISIVLIIADIIIITPYEVTFAQKIIPVFIGILSVTYISEKRIGSKSPDGAKKVLYAGAAAMALPIIFAVLRKDLQGVPSFYAGCFMQSMLSIRKRRGRNAGTPGAHESPMPDIGFRVMSVVLFIRDLVINHKRILKSAGIGEGDVVLDYGCGPGAFTLAASRIVGGDGTVYALDNHPMAIKSVEARVRKHGISNVKTILTDQGDTGLPDGSVDNVIFIGVLHILRNPERVLREIARVMKDGGRLILDSMFFTESELIKILSHLFRLEEKLKGMYIFKKI